MPSFPAVRRLAPLVWTLVCGCLAGADEDVSQEPELLDEPELAYDEAALGGPLLDPCPTPAVDVSVPLGPGGSKKVSGAVDATNACDWYVLETTGVLGGDLLLQASSASLQGQGIVVPSAAACEASTMRAQVTGQLPSGGWSTVTSFTEHGLWTGTSCAFPAFQQVKNLSGGGLLLDTPYTRVRTATRAWLKTSEGTVAGALSTMASRKDY